MGMNMNSGKIRILKAQPATLRRRGVMVVTMSRDQFLGALNGIEVNGDKVTVHFDGAAMQDLADGAEQIELVVCAKKGKSTPPVNSRHTEADFRQKCSDTQSWGSGGAESPQTASGEHVESLW